MISFSLYMWHLPFLLIFIQWLQPLLKGWSPEQAYSIYWLWVMLVIIPFCFLFYTWVEKPGMHFGERFIPQKVKTAPPTSKPSGGEAVAPVEKDERAIVAHHR
jgi:peptidoglycan/LPS O-acetylase OafA/YrhL